MSRPISCLFSHLVIFLYLALCPFLAFFPHLAFFSYLIRCPPILAFFSYCIFDSLPIETSVLSERRRDGATASHSSLISCSELSSPSHTQYAYSIIHPHPIFLSNPNPSDPVNVHWLTDGIGFLGARSQQRYRSLMRRLAEAGRGWQTLKGISSSCASARRRRLTSSDLVEQRPSPSGDEKSALSSKL